MEEETGELGVLSTDRELVVRSWNAWLADVTGIPAAIACGRSLTDLYPEVEQRGLVARLRRVAEEGAVEVLAPAFHQYLIPCPPREPSTRFARMQQHVTVAPLRVEDEVVGVTITVRDVTARRERERRIADQLSSADEGARLRAVETLAAVDASPDVLVGAFDDRSWRVRSAAVEAVAQHGGEEVAEVLTHVLREQHQDLSVLNATLSALAASHVEVLPSLVALLESPEADVRVYVALALGLRGDLRAVPALVRALSDGDLNVRFHALEALGRLRARSAADAVAEVAETRDFTLSFAALDALAAIGDETVAPRIAPLLQDQLLSPAVLAALGRLGGEEAVAPLTAMLVRDEVTTAEVAEALAAIHARFQNGFGDGEVIAQLVGATVTPEGARRLLAACAAAAPAELPALARVLGWLEVEGADQALARALARPEARHAAVEGLARLGSRAVDGLVRELELLPPGALRGAALALGRMGSAAAVPALLDLLDSEPEVVAAAADALGRIGDGVAFEPLIHLLGHPQAAVRQTAVGALSSIGHPALRERVGELLQSSSPAVRESAVRVAGYFGYDEYADALVALCHDTAESVRRAAIEHLVYLDDPRVPATLREALRFNSAPARAAAARALARLPTRAAADLLPGALDDPDLWVRYYAARSAGSLGPTPVLARVAELAVHDPAIPVRIAAVDALGAVGTPETVPTLCALAGESDPELRVAVLAALARSAEAGALRVVGRVLRADDPAVQRIVLDSLGRDAARALAPRLQAAARAARDPEVARVAVLALRRAGSAEAVRLLCALAAEPPLREPCVQVLASLPAERLDVLAEELRRGEEATRDAILAALAHMPHAAAARLAALALDDPSASVRRTAAHTLVRLDLRATVAGR